MRWIRKINNGKFCFVETKQFQINGIEKKSENFEYFRKVIQILLRGIKKYKILEYEVELLCILI